MKPTSNFWKRREEREAEWECNGGQTCSRRTADTNGIITVESPYIVNV
jgi:hypothetical protein